MKITTYNVNRGTNAKGEPTLKNLKEYILSSKADIVALQLAPQDFVDDLARSLGSWQSVFGLVPDTTYGNAIVTRFEIESQGIYDLPTVAPLEGRNLLKVQLKTGSGYSTPLVVVVTHLENTSEDVRMEQLKFVLDQVEEDGRAHILCGDFNALTISDYSQSTWQRFVSFATERKWEPRQERVTRLLAENGYIDAFKSVGDGDPFTFHLAPLQMDLRIDYIFLSKQFGWELEHIKHAHKFYGAVVAGPLAACSISSRIWIV
ncbi:hypothetical protein CYMTET_3654 [Cymbomonas tetramitiformis]|uniref:Endonuclease/exonuclease/phosphatase domain-containing protein n=1 Tax=Cymbomonas tetramitiformis TaxID=36881 RepID=A0AAE0LKV2_9CHLO|nr:hypothetical protein CYMTET_3654 [Cymbomonas tetramitiformis]